MDALLAAAWLGPPRSGAWLLLVPLYLEQRRLEEAASAAFSALELDPERHEARLAVAATLGHLGVVGVADSLFRVTIPRLPTELRARYERAGPLPPDGTPFAGASSPAGAGDDPERAGALRPEDEERLWVWSQITEREVLLPAPERNPAETGPDFGTYFGASQAPVGRSGAHFEWARGDSATRAELWESPELGVRMELIGRLLACRPDVPESRSGAAAVPPGSSLARMYERILAALGGEVAASAGTALRVVPVQGR